MELCFGSEGAIAEICVIGLPSLRPRSLPVKIVVPNEARVQTGLPRGGR
jgi:hypothetical protein